MCAFTRTCLLHTLTPRGPKWAINYQGYFCPKWFTGALQTIYCFSSHPSPKYWSHHGSRQVLVPRRLRWLWDQDCQENSHKQQPLGLHFFHRPFTFSSVFWLVHSYWGLMFPHHSEDLWWLNPPSYIPILLVQKQNYRYSKWQWRNVLYHVYNRNIHWSVNF